MFLVRSVLDTSIPFLGPLDIRYRDFGCLVHMVFDLGEEVRIHKFIAFFLSKHKVFDFGTGQVFELCFLIHMFMGFYVSEVFTGISVDYLVCSLHYLLVLAFVLVEA